MLERDLFMTSDATPAYRGYRLQHLYTLWRILQDGDQESIAFQLEGQEDLQGVSLFQEDASKVRLTPFEPAACRECLEAALRRSRLIVCRLVRLLHSCSRCDTPPPGRVPVPGC